MTDLASLVVRLEAEVGKYATNLDKATSRLSKFERDNTTALQKIDKRFAQLGNSIKSVLAVAGAGALLAKAVSASAEAAKNFALLENAVERAGTAAGGRTAKQFADVSKQLQNITTYSDDAVQGVQQVLLRFQNIRTDRFDEATKSVLDFAAATGQDATAAAETLGKALAAPEKGMTQLARAGVILSDGQKEVIKNLVETGRRAEAQGILLDALAKRFGGAAEAARNNFSGALAGVKNALDDLFEADAGLPAATDSLNEMSKVLQDPAVRAGADALFSGLIRGASAAAEFIAKIAGGIAVLAGAGKDEAVNLDNRIRQVQSRLDLGGFTGDSREEVAALKAELNSLTDEYDKLEGLGLAGIEASKGLKQLNDTAAAFELPDIEVTDPSAKLAEAAEKLRTKLEAAGTALTQSLSTPLEIYNQKVAEADKLLNAQVITLDTWARALGKARGELEGFGSETADAFIDSEEMARRFDDSLLTVDEDLEKMIDKTFEPLEAEFDDLGKQLDEQIKDMDKVTDTFFHKAAENAQDILGDGIYDALKNGFDGGIEDVLDSFADMLLKLAAQAIAANIGQYLFGSGKTGDDSGGIFGQLFSSIAGAYAGGKASGGDVQAGMAYRVNEKTAKSEWFVPRTAGRIVQDGGRGGQTIQQNFTIQAPQGTVSRQTQMQVGAAAAAGLGTASRRNN